MTSPDSFDLEYRPNHYFGPQDLKTFYRARITGQIRGNLVVKSIEGEEIPKELKQSSLNEQLRTAQGSIHPSMMGGEFLPSVYENDLEIARVVLETTTMDVTSLRVRKQRNRFVYKMVDEYSNQFVLPQKTSVKPLRMVAVIAMINECKLISYDDGTSLTDRGIVLPNIEYLVGEHHPKSEILSFVNVESAFYPELNSYFEDQKLLWIDELCGEGHPE
tara:strand:- start:199 stop:852 length:654 start_codon:yes stop_codon:yes gene_type:complete